MTDRSVIGPISGAGAESGGARSPAAGFIAIFLLAALVGIAIAVPLLLFQKAGHYRERISEQMIALESLNEAIATGRGVVASPPANVLVSGESIGRGQAEQQSLLTEAASAAGITLRSIQPLSVQRNGDLVHIPVEIAFEAQTDNLSRYIHALETGFPLVLIDELMVRRLGRNDAEPSSVLTRGDRAASLDVSIKLRVIAGPNLETD
jgi:hypothetical protein